VRRLQLALVQFPERNQSVEGQNSNDGHQPDSASEESSRLNRILISAVPSQLHTALLTTITAQLDPDLARRVAKAADLLKLTHEEFATEAVRLFVRSVGPDVPARKPRKKSR
jgi:hypothetical protein